MLPYHQVLLRCHCNTSPKTDHCVFSLDPFILFSTQQLVILLKHYSRSFKVIQGVLRHYIPDIYHSASCSLLPDDGHLITIPLRCLTDRTGKIRMQDSLLKFY